MMDSNPIGCNTGTLPRLNTVHTVCINGRTRSSLVPADFATSRLRKKGVGICNTPDNQNFRMGRTARLDGKL